MLWQRTRERLRERGIDPEPPSLKYAVPILEAAADEENEELQDVWSHPLAAAMDPNRRDAMRQSCITTVKKMDPIDALVLKAVRDNRPVPRIPVALDAIPSKLKCSTDEVVVSIEHLAQLSCIPAYASGERMSGIDPFLKPFGILLMNVVSG